MSNQINKKFREEVAKLFVEQLKDKGLNWKKGWKKSNVDLFHPISFSTEKTYNGINQFYLWLTAEKNGYTDNRWLTFNQIKSKGWHLDNAKGKGVHIEYWFPYDVENEKGITWKEYNELKSKKEFNIENYPIVAKIHTVFNASLVKEIEPLEVVETKPEIDIDGAIQEMANNMGVEILNDGGNRAFYRPSEDKIHLPLKDRFENNYEYNATLLHELSHSTGHPDRLNREQSGKFGSEQYAYEELIAELSSLFLSHDFQLDQTEEHIKNHQAYVNSWISAIEDNPDIFVKAIKQANECSDYMLEKANLEHNLVQTKTVPFALTEEEKAYVENHKDYWVIEMNECDDHIQSYKGQILNTELLEKIKGYDNQISLYKLANNTHEAFEEGSFGYYKFYFDHVVNGEVVDHLRVDVGDGIEVNHNEWQYLKSELFLKEAKESIVQRFDEGLEVAIRQPEGDWTEMEEALIQETYTLLNNPDTREDLETHYGNNTLHRMEGVIYEAMENHEIQLGTIEEVNEQFEKRKTQSKGFQIEMEN